MVGELLMVIYLTKFTKKSYIFLAMNFVFIIILTVVKYNKFLNKIPGSLYCIIALSHNTLWKKFVVIFR